MADAVTSSTIITNSFKNLYDLLTDSTNGFTDPASRGLARTKWVMPAFPDEHGSDFPSYPIVTIEVNADISNLTLGSGTRSANIPFVVTIFARKMQYVDSLSDQVQNIVHSYRATMEANLLFKPVITNTDTNTVFRDKDKIHMRTIFITYRWGG